MIANQPIELQDFVGRAERALVSGELGSVPNGELERVLTAAVRLYAAKAETDETLRPVTGHCVTPTDVVVTVTAILKEAGLNLWDLSMWLGRGPR